ncbi:nuclear transport factor 2 family protein [Hymenobacter sp. BT730]|uniref:nuclear transport factor 2 family protein n=1 Tax=Hymenobacter sp. BT730 TaxID=3063332 RepID=UPI0026DFF536|nr:nuclear transport factor 2 family protein [Hymenobacter sp. BT730]
MNEQQNTQTVQEGYSFFNKGDIPNLLTLFTDDIEFILPGAADTIPYAGVFRGKEQVTTFFTKLHDAIQYERFEPQDFIAQGQKVVALGYSKGQTRSNGQIFEEEWAHVFELRDGKISRFQSFTDTAALVQAFQASKKMAF